MSVGYLINGYLLVLGQYLDIMMKLQPETINIMHNSMNAVKFLPTRPVLKLMAVLGGPPTRFYRRYVTFTSNVYCYFSGRQYTTDRHGSTAGEYQPFGCPSAGRAAVVASQRVWGPAILPVMATRPFDG